jgi:tRNA threonylcarbamoyladenosine biosynthesis protein TsaB
MSAFELAIETSTPIGSVALGSSSGLLGEITLGASVKHAEALLPAVQQLLKSCSARPADLARIVVGGGPGSFTGLRIAAATAKGMVHALGVPLFAYSGLLCAAASTGLHDQPVCALFDARRSEVYAACYTLGAEIETLLEPSVFHLDELMSALAPRSVVFAGEGALKHEDRLREHGGIVLPAAAGVPRASTLLLLAGQCPQLGRVQDAARWEPDYLRASSAERGISG